MIINSKFNKGFTLIELLASIIVLIVVGSVITGIISSSLRGSNKANTIENIRQNGNYTLNQMSKDIEYALPFDGKNTGFSNSSTPTAYDTSCLFALGPTPTPITPYTFITVESASNKITQYNCASSPPVLTAGGIPLTDSTVSLLSCSFNCIQDKATDAPRIKIRFSIGPKNSNGLMENITTPIVFETSVTLRNYKK